jgi:Uma2 family endonuclease
VQDVGVGYRFTVEDLARMNPQPWDDTRYEIIDGELHVSTQPHVYHQRTSSKFAFRLEAWNEAGGGGVVLPAPGIVFAPDEAVAPDVGWYESEESFRRALGDGLCRACPGTIPPD